MKTKNFFSLLGAVCVIFFVSCKKDDNSSSQKFSPLTVEQNKANIEDNGTQMLSSIKEIEATTTVDAAQNMMDYMDRVDLFENNPNISSSSSAKVSQFNKLIKPVVIAANLKKFNAKRVANELKVEFDPQTLLELWNGLKGTYTWNSTEQSWSWVTGNNIIIKFPSTKSGTSNNVEFSVYDFEYEEGPFSWTEDYSGELPKQIKSDLKVDGVALLSYTLNITYNAEKIPNSISTSLEIPPFKFAYEVTNSKDTHASITFEWTKSTTTLVKFSLTANGNWSETNTSNDELEPGDVITDGNATFQLMNIKITGNVNVKKLNTEINAIDPLLSEELQTEKECELINKYASLAVCYVDNNQIIALIIAYPYEKTDTYWNYVYNSSTQSWESVKVTDTWWEVGMKFKFADESTTDLDTYFTNGFSNLLTAVESYLETLQSTYSSK